MRRRRNQQRSTTYPVMMMYVPPPPHPQLFLQEAGPAFGDSLGSYGVVLLDPAAAAFPVQGLAVRRSAWCCCLMLDVWVLCGVVWCSSSSSRRRRSSSNSPPH